MPSPSDLVTDFTAKIPVTGDLYGDISRSMQHVYEELKRKGWLVMSVQPVQTGTGYWSGAATYGAIIVRVRKPGGAPFSQAVAKQEIAQAASSVGLKIAGWAQWVIQVAAVTNPVTVTSTAYQGVKSGESIEALKEKTGGGLPDLPRNLSCIGVELATGLPCWLVVGGAVTLAALGFYVWLAGPSFIARTAKALK